MPGIIGNTGAERSSAWIWAFSSTHSTNAFSGGSTYSPTTSRTLSTNCGSVDSLNVSTWWGLSPNAFQIRPTVERLRPLWAAIDARDQCVASAGVCSKVATTTASICASVIFRGPPGRGSSTNPPNRDSTNRPRHVPTVCGHTPNSAATRLFAFPSAQPSTDRPPHPGGRRHLPPPRPTQQRLALVVGQHHLGHRPTSPRHPGNLHLWTRFQAQDTSGEPAVPAG